jgi:hypothetical protein
MREGAALPPEKDRLAISPSTGARIGLDIARAADLATVMSEPHPSTAAGVALETE